MKCTLKEVFRIVCVAMRLYALTVWECLAEL